MNSLPALILLPVSNSILARATSHNSSSSRFGGSSTSSRRRSRGRQRERESVTQAPRGRHPWFTQPFVFAYLYPSELKQGMQRSYHRENTRSHPRERERVLHRPLYTRNPPQAGMAQTKPRHNRGRTPGRAKAPRRRGQAPAEPGREEQTHKGPVGADPQGPGEESRTTTQPEQHPQRAVQRQPTRGQGEPSTPEQRQQQQSTQAPHRRQTTRPQKRSTRHTKERQPAPFQARKRELESEAAASWSVQAAWKKTSPPPKQY